MQEHMMPESILDRKQQPSFLARYTALPLSNEYRPANRKRVGASRDVDCSKCSKIIYTVVVAALKLRADRQARVY